MEPKCNLIIDSCCDLPYDVVNQPGIELIGFPFTLDGEERTDDFYQSITPKQFYDVMRDKKRIPPTTSQLPAGTLMNAFTRAIESGVPTVYLAFSSGLSGSYDASVLMRDNLLATHPGAELYVVDTKLASIAEGLLVLGAIEQRKAGLTAKEMVAWVEEARYFVGAQFMVDDLDALRRGGRIPASVAMAGAKLDVKALLSFDLEGHLALVRVARGRKKGIRFLADHYKKNVVADQPVRQIITGNSDCPKDAQRLREEIEKDDPEATFLETSIGPVIGSHVGPGMLAIVFWGPDRRKELSVADRIAQKVKGKEQ